MTRDDNKHMSVTFATKSAQICACLISRLRFRKGNRFILAAHGNIDKYFL